MRFVYITRLRAVWKAPKLQNLLGQATKGHGIEELCQKTLGTKESSTTNARIIHSTPCWITESQEYFEARRDMRSQSGQARYVLREATFRGHRKPSCRFAIREKEMRVQTRKDVGGTLREMLITLYAETREYARSMGKQRIPPFFPTFFGMFRGSVYV